jgi:hypothetical protein
VRQRELGFAAQGGQRRAQFVRHGGAELFHVADGMFQACERVVERHRELVQFITGAVHGETLRQVVHVDRSRLGR